MSGQGIGRVELSVMLAEWLCAIPDFELERGFTLSFTSTQGGAVTPSSLPLRWATGEQWDCLHLTRARRSRSADRTGDDGQHFLPKRT